MNQRSRPVLLSRGQVGLVQAVKAGSGLVRQVSYGMLSQGGQVTAR